MKAEVPYLARLARHAAARPMLWPPRQLFTGGIDMPVLPPDRAGSPRRHAVSAATSLPGPLAPAADGEPNAREAIAPGHGVDTGGERTAGPERRSSAATSPATVQAATVLPVTSTAHGATAAPATSARQEPAPAIPVTRGSPERHEPPQAEPRQQSAPYSAPPAAGPADSAGARSAASPEEPPPTSSRSRPEGGTGRARPPGSWASPLWGAPVDLPEAIEFAPVTGEATRRAISASPAGPATPPAGPGTAATAGTRQGQRTGDVGPSVARRAADHQVPDAEDAADPYRPREPAPVRDLRPPPPSRARPAAMSGTEPGEPHRELRAPGRPQVSIGTIEVTVLPPAPAVHEAQPSPPVARGWSRPPSLLASSAGMDRLRDGLRRWYGTAQG
jgi:hypothetical protein